MARFSIYEHYTAKSFWICQNICWENLNLIEILDMAELWICKSYTGFLIYHNMTAYVLIARELDSKVSTQGGYKFHRNLNSLGSIFQWLEHFMYSFLSEWHWKLLQKHEETKISHRKGNVMKKFLSSWI